MSTSLWRRIKRFVTSGRETPKVDLKLIMDISGKVNKAEFAKDVTAIANTPGGDGLIIIGVRDVKDRQSQEPGPEKYIPGFQAPRGPDAFHRQMVDALTQFCNRVPAVEYDEIKHPTLDRSIGVITVKRSTKRPHSLIRGSGDIQQHQTWIRRGTAAYPATADEIVEMANAEELPAATIINLSTHPITDKQREQIECDMYIEELIELPVHLDATQNLQPQIEQTIDAIGLTPEEWSSKLIGIVLPGIAPGAAALLAYVHGLRGGFPKVFWIYQHPDDRTRYSVAQIINLQELRDVARRTRVR